MTHLQPGVVSELVSSEALYSSSIHSLPEVWGRIQTGACGFRERLWSAICWLTLDKPLLSPLRPLVSSPIKWDQLQRIVTRTEQTQSNCIICSVTGSSHWQFLCHQHSTNLLPSDTPQEHRSNCSGSSSLPGYLLLPRLLLCCSVSVLRHRWGRCGDTVPL